MYIICPFIFVIIPNILSTIMSHVYLVPLSYTCYTPCGNTLFMDTYTLHCIYSALWYWWYYNMTLLIIHITIIRYPHVLYYYRACITIVHIVVSFIFSLTRSLSDDSGFACLGWRSKISLYQIFFEILLRPSPFLIYRYLCDLFLLSYFSLF